MLDILRKGLSDLIRKLITRTSVDKKLVEEVLQDLKKVLLNSDVDIKLTEELLINIRRKCLEEKIPPGLTLREHVLKVIYDELVKLLGERPVGLLGKKRIMLVGLFGAGKTVTLAKLGKYFLKQGLKPVLVGLDYHRPAATDQLLQLGKQVGIPVYVEESKNPFSTAKNALRKFGNYDVLIFDTAGRNALDKELADELKKLAEIIKPDEVLLIIPADLGKVAREQSEEFHKLVGITGVIITKMDGTAKAGGALVGASVTGAKVKFIGTGEHLDDFEVYDPQRFVSRLLGLGDLQTLLEKAKEAEIKPEKMEKIVEGKFTFQDFLEQMEALQKMGPFSKILQMIPGLGMADIPEELSEMQESKFKKYKAIIQSMTKEERENPDIINSSRIARISRGAGVKEVDVRELLNLYNQLKKVSKMLKGRGEKDIMNLIKKFGGKLPFSF
ncbi:MAG: signal recognition particle receptor subunit alpha [Candidatus Aenigmatarchaeota archaeon]